MFAVARARASVTLVPISSAAAAVVAVATPALATRRLPVRRVFLAIVVLVLITVETRVEVDEYSVIDSTCTTRTVYIRVDAVTRGRYL